MVQPIEAAISAWLAIWNNLPLPIHAICNLAFVLLLVGAILDIFWHIR